MNVFKALEKQGYRVDYIGVNSNGELDLEALASAVDEDTALVATMWANNETGVINPIGKISEIVKSKIQSYTLMQFKLQVKFQLMFKLTELIYLEFPVTNSTLQKVLGFCM